MMFAPTLRYVAFAAGLLGALPGGAVFPPFLQAASVSNTGHRPLLRNPVVTFGFSDLDASGDIPLGQPLTLSLTLNGVAQGRSPLAVVYESLHYQPQIVTMEPDPFSSGMRATAILEPIATGKLSVTPKYARIRVTFFRTPTDRKPERIMVRIVYVTLGKQDRLNSDVELPSPSEEDSAGKDASDEDVPPDAIPIADESLVEEDLLPLPDPEQGEVYWQHVSALLSRSWSRTAHRVRHAPSSETVRVRFRMYPNGRAQLIEIGKGSGAREIDEAGIQAIVHAQPFPPFPDDIGSEPVDVHVRMRTGARRGARDVRSVSNSQRPRSTGATAAPKR